MTVALHDAEGVCIMVAHTAVHDIRAEGRIAALGDLIIEDVVEDIMMNPLQPVRRRKMIVHVAEVISVEVESHVIDVAVLEKVLRLRALVRKIEHQQPIQLQQKEMSE